MTPKQIISSLYEAFGRGDIPFIVEHFAAGASFRQPASVPWGGQYSGPEGAAQFFQRLNEGVETTGFTVEHSVEVGNEVFSVGVHDAIVRTTRRPVSVRWMFRWRVEHGKVTAYEAFYDAAPIVEALQRAATASA
jgi:ketosteroid isomerase-like protein